MRRAGYLDVPAISAYTVIYANGKALMVHIARLFNNGRSQAVRLPMAYRFDVKEVFIRQDPATGDVILSRKPPTWDEFLDAIKGGAVSSDFLDASERGQGQQHRDPLAGWRE
jgi:antitoxin VapB